METFNLKFSVENSAFEGNDRPLEIARILRKLAEGFEEGQPDNLVRDINGNRVGQWFMDDE